MYCRFPESCHQLNKHGFDTPGNYRLDLTKNFTHIKVYCEFPENKTIIKPIENNLCNSSKCQFSYENLEQIQKLVHDSTQACHQNVSLTCTSKQLQWLEINGDKYETNCNKSLIIKSSLVTNITFQSSEISAEIGPLSCQYSAWTPWSQFSSCSTTCGENGIKVRTRQCLASPEDCIENDTEKKACTENLPCKDVFLLIASGNPDPDQGLTELINWSQKKHCKKYISYWDESLSASGGYFNNTPFLCGGQGPNHGRVRNQCWILNSQSWKNAPVEMKQPRVCHASLILGDKIIISGGLASDGYDKLASSEIIHKNGTVEYGPDLQARIHGHCMVLFNSQIWVLGGSHKDKSTVMIHDLDFQFLRFGPLMIDERIFHACTLISIKGQEFLMVLGGSGPFPRTQQVPELLNPITNTWRKVSGVTNLSSRMFYYPSILKLSDETMVVTDEDQLYEVVLKEEVGIEGFKKVMNLKTERSKPVLFNLPNDHFLAKECFNY